MNRLFLIAIIACVAVPAANPQLIGGIIGGLLNVLKIPLLGGGFLDVSVLLGKTVRIGDLVVLDKNRGLNLNLLSLTGSINLNLVYDKGVTIGDLVVVDKVTCRNAGIPDNVNDSIDATLRSQLVVAILNKFAISSTTQIYADIVASNGALLTIDVLKSIGVIPLRLTALDGARLDVSAVLGQFRRCGDFVVIDKFRAFGLNLLSVGGVVNLNLIVERGIFVDDLFIIDRRTAIFLGIWSDGYSALEVDIRAKVVKVILNRLGVPAGSSIEASILSNNGLLTIDLLKQNRFLSLKITLPNGLRLDVSGLFGKLGRFGEIVVIDRFRAISLNLLTAAGALNLNVIIEKAFIVEDLVFIDRQTALPIGLLDTEIDVLANDLRLALVKVFLKAAGVVAGSTVELEVIASNGALLTIDYLKKIGVFGLSVIFNDGVRLDVSVLFRKLGRVGDFVIIDKFRAVALNLIQASGNLNLDLIIEKAFIFGDVVVIDRWTAAAVGILEAEVSVIAADLRLRFLKLLVFTFGVIPGSAAEIELLAGNGINFTVDLLKKFQFLSLKARLVNGIREDVSVLFGKVGRIGDFVIIDKFRAFTFNILTAAGSLNLDLIVEKAFIIDDLVFIDRQTALLIGILDAETDVLTYDLRLALVKVFLKAAGVVAGSAIELEVVASNGALLTIDYLKKVGVFALKVIFNDGARVDVSVLFRKLGRVGDFVIIDRFRAFTLNLLLATGDLNLDLIIEKAFIFGDVVVIDRWTAAAVGILETEISVITADLRTRFLKLLIFSFGIVPGSAAEIELLASNGLALTVTFLKKIQVLPLTVSFVNEIRADVSVLFGKLGRVGDFVIIDRFRAITLNILSLTGNLNLDLIFEKAFVIGDVVVIDRWTAAAIGILDAEIDALTAELRVKFARALSGLFGIAVGSAGEIEIFASNGAALTVDFLKKIGSLPLWVKFVGEIRTDVSILLGKVGRVGDFVIIDKFRAIALNILSANGDLNLDLIFEKAFIVGDVVIIDRWTAAALQILDTEVDALTTELRAKFVKSLTFLFGITIGSAAELEIIVSNGALLTLEHLKKIGAFALNVIFNDGVRVDVSVLFRKLGRVGDFVIIDRFRAIALNLLQASGNLNLDLVIEKAFVFGDVVVIDRWTATAVGILNLDVDALTTDLRLRFLKLLVFSFGVIPGSAAEIELLAGNGINFTVDFLKKFQFLALKARLINGIREDVSVLFGKVGRIGDFVIIDKFRAITLNILTAAGSLNLDLIVEKAYIIDDLVFIDRQTALLIGILDAELDVLVDDLRLSLTRAFLKTAGVVAGSAIELEVVASNGALLTIDYLKKVGVFALKVIFNDGARVDVSVLFRKLGRVGDFVIIDRFRAFTLNLLLATGDLNLDLIIEKAFLFGDVVVIDRWTAAAVGILEAEINVITTDLRLRFLKLLIFSFGIVPGSAAEVELIASNGVALTIDFLKKIKILPLKADLVDGIRADVSILFGKLGRVGDFVIIDKFRAISLNILTVAGSIDLTLVVEKAFIIGDVIVIDRWTAAAIDILDAEIDVITSDLRLKFVRTLCGLFGIAVGSAAEVEVIASNGAALTVNFLKKIGSLPIWIILESGARLDVSVLLNKVGRCGDFFVMDKFKAIALGILTASGEINVDIVVKKVIIIGDVVCVDNLTAANFNINAATYTGVQLLVKIGGVLLNKLGIASTSLTYLQLMATQCSTLTLQLLVSLGLII